jgi:hypothetical protein
MLTVQLFQNRGARLNELRLSRLLSAYINLTSLNAPSLSPTIAYNLLRLFELQFPFSVNYN